MRSIWKGPYYNNLLVSLNKKNQSFINIPRYLQLSVRSSTILPFFLYKTVFVHTGNKYIKILITKDMLGHKFGEFVFTKKRCTYKKKKKRK